MRPADPLALPAALVLAASLAGPAAAAEPDLVFPAGLACDFALGFSGVDPDPTIYREFTDAEGNVVRALLTGVGGDTTMTNMDTGATRTQNATGSVGIWHFRPDGSYTMEAW